MARNHFPGHFVRIKIYIVVVHCVYIFGMVLYVAYCIYCINIGVVGGG